MRAPSMPTTARMQLLEQSPPVQEIHIGESALFSAIRRHMRVLFSTMYRQEGDAHENEQALALRFEMMKWLTSPLMPDQGMFQRCGLDDDRRVRQQWGVEASQAVLLLRDLIDRYAKEGSVLNSEFLRLIVDLAGELAEDRVRICCHTKERDLFRDLLNGLCELDDYAFICNLSEYRSNLPFNTLIRFGPLRTSGMAKLPEAVIASPLYRRIVRFVWSGLSDEEGFSADPVLSAHNYLASMDTVRLPAIARPVIWGHSADTEAPAVMEEADDVAFYSDTVRPPAASVRCVMVELPGEYGVLLRPGAHLLIYSPRSEGPRPIGYRTLGEVEPGDYLLVHDADANLGEVSVDAASAPLASLWKKALRDLYERDARHCVQKMKRAGIELQDLHRAVESWTAMHGTVIRAPRRRDHFRALLTQVLDPELIASRMESGVRVPGWRRAWVEVESSRASAIRHGVVENAIVNEVLVTELSREVDDDFRAMISGSVAYRHRLSAASGLVGSVLFRPVIALSTDFAAPADTFGKPLRLPVIEQYRADTEGERLCA
ncbi:hypothetical protein [Cupriavidus sp. H39]|uniref:hypothetical protein n=1 Tax=Cupriavidus sp. H39 TaxID=3401635 RepID=UPI003CFFC8B2